MCVDNVKTQTKKVKLTNLSNSLFGFDGKRYNFMMTNDLFVSERELSIKANMVRSF